MDKAQLIYNKIKLLSIFVFLKLNLYFKFINQKNKTCLLYLQAIYKRIDLYLFVCN